MLNSKQLPSSKSDNLTQRASCIYITNVPNDTRPLTRLQSINEQQLQTGRVHSTSSDIDTPPSCAICLDNVDTNPIKSKDAYTLLSCGHVFHKECIEKWFMRKSYCPLDKQPTATTLYLSGSNIEIKGDQWLCRESSALSTDISEALSNDEQEFSQMF